MKKFIVPALFAFLFVIASCMNMSGGSEKGGSIRVALPGNAREISSSSKADTYIVQLLLNEDIIQTETGFSGGVLEFSEVNPETYTVEVKAYKNEVLSGLGESEVTVVAGETSPCTVTLHDKFTVTFDANGGTGTMPSQVFTYGTSQSLSENLFTKDGSTFQGWATIVDSEPVYNNASVNVFEKTDVTLYAKWSTDGFVFVEGATITEAAPNSEVFINGRTVPISDFYMCDHEVTQSEYKDLIGSLPDPPSDFEPVSTDGNADNNPVNSASWYEAIVYCNKRSIKEGLTPCYTINNTTDTTKWGTVPTSNNDDWNAAICDFTANGYRLPTEVEWEYAARGGNGLTGTQYKYSGSDTIGEFAWYAGNSDNKTHEVKTTKANDLGLYDMSGNVWEWCWDWYSNSDSISSSTPATGPSDPMVGYYNRCERGGSYSNGSSDDTLERLECAYRYSSSTPYKKANEIGFRVVRTAK